MGENLSSALVRIRWKDQTSFLKETEEGRTEEGNGDREGKGERKRSPNNKNIFWNCNTDVSAQER
jgi:hypothetical protein